MAPTSVPLIASKGIASNSPNQPRIWRHSPLYGRRTGQGDQEWLCRDEQAGAGMQEHSPVARHVMPAMIKRPVKRDPARPPRTNPDKGEADPRKNSKSGPKRS